MSTSSDTGPPTLERWTIPFAFGIAALFCAGCVFISLRRMFWFDEVYTTFTTRQPTWISMWRMLVSATEPTPFGYFAIARISDHLFGPGEIGIRLPSVIAVTAGLLVTYFCARRLATGMHGLIAMSLLLCSFLPFYAYEGRAYGIYFLCAALSFWFWLRHSWFGFGIIFLFGILIHYYMIFCLVPFILIEGLQWRPWNRPSRELLAGLAGAFLALVILLPQIIANRATYRGSSELSNVRPFLLQDVYENMFPHLPFLLALTVICAVVLPGKGPSMPPPFPMSIGERIGWLFLAIPVAGFVGAALVTKAFVPRYFVGSLPGIAVALSCSVDRLSHANRRMSAAVLTILLSFGTYNLLRSVRHPELIVSDYSYQPEVRAVLQQENQIWNDGKKYILMPNLLVLPALLFPASGALREIGSRSSAGPWCHT